MAHRYWSINMLKRANDDAAFIGMNEIELRGTIGGADLTGSGTASTDTTEQAGSVSDAFDGNTGNAVQWNWADSPIRIVYDFGSGNDVDINEVSIYPSLHGAGRTPGYFEVAHSDDGTNWTVAYHGVYKSYAANTAVLFQRPQSEDKRVWILADLEAQGGTHGTYAIAELQLRASAGGPDQTGSGTAFASGTFSPASRAVDNDVGNFWAVVSNIAYMDWWGYDFGSGESVEVVQIRMNARDDSFFFQTPTHFDVLYSDDPARNGYILSSSVDTTDDWTLGESRVFDVVGEDVVVVPPITAMQAGQHNVSVAY